MGDAASIEPDPRYGIYRRRRRFYRTRFGLLGGYRRNFGLRFQPRNVVCHQMMHLDD